MPEAVKPSSGIDLSRKPTPQEIDTYAAELEALESVSKTADDNIAAFRSQLITLCKQYGSMPARADKSLRLEGEERLLTATFGQTTEVDDKAIDKFRRELVRVAGARPGWRLFRSMFVEKAKYVVTPNAFSDLQLSITTKFASRGSRECRRLVRLFQACVRTKPKAASLKAEPKVQEKAANA